MSKEININLEEEEAYRGVVHLLNDKGSWHLFENKLDHPISVIAIGISLSFGSEVIQNSFINKIQNYHFVNRVLKTY